MRWVQTATIAPHRCAAIPFVGHNSRLGFIDTGSELSGHDQHVYISGEAVEQMAQIFDWSPPAAVHALQELTALQAERIGQLEEQLAEADRVADAFDIVKRRKAQKAVA